MTTSGDPFEVALRQLQRRPRTVSEVRRHLRGRGFGIGEIADVVARLARLGYVDDRDYARRYAAWATAEKPMGRRRVTQELMRRGVPRDTIEETLGEAFGPEQEAEALARALTKVTRRAGAAPDEKTRRRVASALLRRGFNPG